jgi:hypothetical protein
MALENMAVGNMTIGHKASAAAKQAAIGNASRNLDTTVRIIIHLTNAQSNGHKIMGSD